METLQRIYNLLDGADPWRLFLLFTPFLPFIVLMLVESIETVAKGARKRNALHSSPERNRK